MRGQGRGTESPRDRDGGRFVKAQRLISLFVLLAIIALGGLYFSRHREEFYLITTIAPDNIVGLFANKLVQAVVLGWQLKILTDAYGLRLAFSQWFGISRLTTFAGLFLPFPGAAAIRAVYLKRCYD